MAKLVTAKINILATSDLLESFGGAGYIENTGIPKFLRDAQVLSIWEGTTNVLSLDLLRVLKKEEAFSVFTTEISEKLENFNSDFTNEKDRLKTQLSILSSSVQELKEAPGDTLQAHARELAFTMGRLMSATLMIEHAQISQREIDKLCAKTFCERDFISLRINMNRYVTSRRIAFEDF
jgi:hypothetical protein